MNFGEDIERVGASKFLMNRFRMELEFVQCLCNPYYLHHLHQEGYFDDPEFLKFLDYLEYWRAPKYSKYLLYPQCLNILGLLKSESFVKSLADLQAVELLVGQQYLRWKHNR